MATKAELIAYASSAGVDVSESWTKADIEAALSDAGYDPDDATSEETAVAEERTPDDQIADWADTLMNTSSDARFATYTEATPDPTTPPPGRLVEQTRGEASEA